MPGSQHLLDLCTGQLLCRMHDTHFIAAKASTTLRLLTLIRPMPG